MSSPVQEETITKEQVEDWLSRASLRKLNIFHDQRKIMVLLCKALLRAWSKLGWDKDEESKPSKPY